MVLQGQLITVLRTKLLCLNSPNPSLLLWNGLITSAQAALLGLCEASVYRMPVPQGAPMRGETGPGRKGPGSAPPGFPEIPPFPFCTLSLEILSHSWSGHARESFPPHFQGPQSLLTSSFGECGGWDGPQLKVLGTRSLCPSVCLSLLRGPEVKKKQAWSVKRVGLWVAQHGPAPHCPHPKPS